MESAYRLWIREKKDEICKELQAALGTAKWQVLFEFLHLRFSVCVLVEFLKKSCVFSFLQVILFEFLHNNLS